MLVTSSESQGSLSTAGSSEERPWELDCQNYQYNQQRHRQKNLKLFSCECKAEFDFVSSLQD